MSWERHGRNVVQFERTVIMGLISDRGAGYDPRRAARGARDRQGEYGQGRADGYGDTRYHGYGRDQDPGYDDARADTYRDARAGGYDYGQAAGYRDGWDDEYGNGLDDNPRRRPASYDPGPRAPRSRPVRRRRPAGRGGYRRRAGNRPVPVVAVIAVVASIAVVAAALGASRLLTTRTVASDAAAPNANCTLIVPANPLSAQGLASPYQLTATNPADGPCNEANTAQTAFVQGAVIDPATGQISVYDPLVIDAGTQPAVAPVVPTLPAGAVVAVWFGYNGDTLSLAGPDQVSVTPSQGATSATPAPTASPSAASPTAASPTAASPTAASPTSASPTSAAPTGSASATVSQTPSGSPTVSGTPAASSDPSASGEAGTPSPSAPAAGTAPAAATQAEGAAPLSPDSSQDARFNATLTRIGRSAAGQGGAGTRHQESAVSASPPVASPPVVAPSGSAPAAASASPSASSPAPGAPSGPASPSMSAAPTMSAPPTAAGDTPAASGSPDAILQQANCVAGEDFGGTFSPFTQVGACNAVAFWSAANAAVRSGKLRVPRPGTAADGKQCLTTRSFALIDQDQSDNVTAEYLAEPNGQTAQDTSVNRQSMAGPATLFNGSDNGLLDSFVAPALGCSPWQVPNLADGGAPATALPLDELQAARWAGSRGGPAALVPLNDPMTLDPNGQFSTDKTNTYRSLMDMRPVPAGQSPRTYCADMERIQGTRLQQDVNLLTQNPGPAPDAANSLFTFLAMRLQQSFDNLNCGSFGLQNDVSTTVDGNGVVVAACFLHQVAPVTAGPGNPMAGTATCPATSGPASPGASSAGASSPAGAGASAPAGPAPSATASSSPWRHHHHRWRHWG
jgi:hypothetical protein